jgi:hypothetical protein
MGKSNRKANKKDKRSKKTITSAIKNIIEETEGVCLYVRDKVLRAMKNICLIALISNIDSVIICLSYNQSEYKRVDVEIGPVKFRYEEKNRYSLDN